jgi:hypothetical protein
MSPLVGVNYPDRPAKEIVANQMLPANWNACTRWNRTPTSRSPMRPSTRLRHHHREAGQKHPTMKPVELVERAG